ncbi:MAG TPA: phosphoenolpyruvate--protein phosphotransferase [Thermodesulfobacteriota bacterium]|jgi:phosphotransferase system enzyme I (PtsI)
MRFKLKGIAISPGVALGRVALLDRTKTFVERSGVDPAFIQSEKERFLSAVQKSKKHLRSIIERFDPMEKGDHLEVLNFNIMMLEDDLFCEEVIRAIESELASAEWAITYVLSKKSEAFKHVEDIYMKERLADIYHLGEIVLHNLRDVKDDVPDLKGDSVLVAHDISPIDLIAFSKHRAIGLATDIGGTTSHSAIVARSLGIPTVMGLEDIILKVSPGDPIFIDGYNGIVIVNFADQERGEFIKREKDYQALARKLKRYAKLPSRTLDGMAIKVNANIEIADEIEQALSYGAEGIGMYRTEFLFTRSNVFPTEQEQFEDYKKLISIFHSSDITIRTLDIGGDKFPPGMEAPKELNPALGLRGIRFSLMDRNIFRTQIRAILKASRFGKIRILIPMVSSLFEIRDTKSIVSGVAREIDSGCSWEIGVMIETPSAAILASEIAEEVDFLSIGTNDLIQYTLAVDRINEHVSYLFSHFHPAVLRLLKSITEAARLKGVPVGVCGEMAGQLSCVPLLVGMGIDELSMNTHSIPKVKKLLNSITKAGCEEILENALKLKTTFDTKDYVIKTILDRWGRSLPLECVQEINSD